MNNKTNRMTLMNELLVLKGQGVKLSYEGMEVEPEEELIDMLLADEGCTYMRNYVFKGEKVVEVEFDKVNLI